MKKILLTLLVPLVLSAAALASPNPASVNAHCTNLLRKAPGAYATMADCVKAQMAVETQNTTNAAAKCKAERDDVAGFAALHPGMTFAQFYGKNANDKNAFGKCVSAKAGAANAAEQAAQLNAAKQCKAWRADPAFATAHGGGKSFADFYGTNANKKNAFGKCVSKVTKANQS